MRHTTLIQAVLVTLALIAAPGVLCAQVYEDDLEAEANGVDLSEEPSEEEELVEEEPEEEPEEEEIRDIMPAPARVLPDYTFGLRLGGGRNVLMGPTDPAGSTTLLFGSAFTGPAVQLGVQGGLLLAKPNDKTGIGIDLGLSYSWMRGRGFAENDERTMRQTIILQAHTLRIPALLMLHRQFAERPIAMHFGVGPEVLFGLASSAEVIFEQVGSEPEPLFTAPTRHVGVMGLLGLSYDTGRFKIPLELRFTWDPQVGTSTQERFEGFESAENPGTYQVAFHRHLHITTGIEWGF